jgi:DNA-binding MarR family transcriptional regulator
MQVDASTLTRNLQPMVIKGWLTIGEGKDARSRLVTATPEGHEMRTLGQKAWKEAQLALNDLLGVKRVLALHELLDSSIATLGEDRVGTFHDWRDPVTTAFRAESLET